MIIKLIGAIRVENKDWQFCSFNPILAELIWYASTAECDDFFGGEFCLAEL